ncbi:MAG TPA: FAD-dependent oxidoreductase [Gammaproteobacteria bacterium]|nr:FAD-dependent oxidoreductase [Gammaproteobacteria bacterium]
MSVADDGIRRDLVVVGGGAGGLVTASVASQLGLAVTLIERGERLGGDCLHHGCVPSKALLRSAAVADLMRRAADFGLPASNPRPDLAAVMGHVRAVIERIQQHDDPERFRGYGCEVLFGEARFTGPRRLAVDGREIVARRVVIATGSRPAVPGIPGLEAAGYWTTDSVFSMPALPRRLAILGAGPSGLELAQAFARLGSRVHLVELAPRLLPDEEADVTRELQAALADDGVRVHAGTRVTRVRTGEALRLELGQGPALECDAILVTTGRRPNVERLDLDAAGVAVTQAGIRVDRRLRTSARGVYACGDVTGVQPLTHVAEHQAGIVLANAVFRLPRRAHYRVVPRVVYTDPELARVGLDAAQAAARGLRVQVMEFPFGEVDRALIDGRARGLARLVVRRGRLLGATVLGPHAGELVHELALAMQARVPVARIAATIHAYPTLAQVHRRAVNAALAPRLYAPGTRRLVKWINRLLP